MLQSTVFAQSTKIKDEFKKLYPKATDVSWAKTDDGQFEVEYTIGEDFFTSVFSEANGWIETSSYLDTESLSSAIKKAAAKYGSADEISGAYLIKNKSGDCYRVSIDTETESITIDVDNTGKVLKETKQAVESYDSEEFDDY